jgi:predicted glycosyltransferase involved in capsule biosynthesis
MITIVSFLLGWSMLMSLGISWKTLVHGWHGPPIGKGISILVPFSTTDPQRQNTWEWLKDYYSVWLPGAEIVVGTSDAVPFCKTEAFNKAYWKCKGDVVVLMDADCYIDCDTLLNCAAEIRSERLAGNKLWYIPYRNFYRLTEAASNAVLESYTTHPLTYPDPPPPDILSSTDNASTGHWFGALIQVMPNEAFSTAGGMDERFAGWGGEDVAFMRAVDTLYAKHKTWAGPVFHM